MDKTFRFVVGLVFLLTALLKAMDAAAFADLMGRYGAGWLGFGAPLLIVAEMLMGLALIFNIRPRPTAFAAASFIAAVSAVFLYGVVAKGISDCGCFGPLTWLNTKPWLTFTRNGLLAAMLVPSMLKPRQGAPLATPVLVCMAAACVAVMFMCGFTFRSAKCLQKQQVFKPVALSDSKLNGYVSCSADSTYLVFAFSYGCPFCMNSIGNVNQYQPMGYVDKVIGLAVSDSAARVRFERLFDVNFGIREIPQLSMARLTASLPTAWLIRHDTIVSQYSGTVVSPALLMQGTE